MKLLKSCDEVKEDDFLLAYYIHPFSAEKCVTFYRVANTKEVPADYFVVNVVLAMKTNFDREFKRESTNRVTLIMWEDADCIFYKLDKQEEIDNLLMEII